MSDIPAHFYPFIPVQDRYSGTYSGGLWIAVRQADKLIDGLARSHWLLEFGPGG